MKRALPKYVYRQTIKGVVYRYFRRGGVTVRVDPSAPDFWHVYARLESDRNPAPSNRTFGALIDHYYRSKKFNTCKPRTQADYRLIAERIRASMGTKDPAKVQRHHVVRWQDELDGRAASYFVQVMSNLLGHAADIGWRQDNPCRGIHLAQTTRKAPHLPWPVWAIEKWRAEARPLPRLIFEVGLGSCQRPADWTRFDWEHFDGDKLTLTQGKTDKPLTIPASIPMKVALAKRPKVMRLGGTPILTGHNGKRLTYRRMAEIMRDERERLGTLAYDLHGLRYTAVQEFARAGCTDDEIASYSGHNTRAMVEKYAGEVRQIARAESARKKRDGG